MRDRFKRRAFILGLAAATVQPGMSWATTYTFDATSTDKLDAQWNINTNWSSDTIPGSGDVAFISRQNKSNLKVSYNYTGAPVTLSSVVIDETNSSTGAPPFATLIMSSNTLSANYEYVGDSGTGSSGIGEFDQSGGTNTISGQTDSVLDLAENSTDIGIYDLNGTGSLTATTMNVGAGGIGTFDEEAGTFSGTTVNVGESTNSNGTIYLNGSTTSFTTTTLNVGVAGPGTLYLNAGTLGVQTLNVNSQAGVPGMVSMGGGTLDAVGENIGTAGTATFTQTSGSNFASFISIGSRSTGTYTQQGGAVSVTGNITLGTNEGTGIYVQAGGTLQAAEEIVGDVKSGTFSQYAGTNNIQTLVVGTGALSTTGAFNLNGGSLTVSTEEIIGDGQSATFTQTAGSNTVTDGPILISSPPSGNNIKYAEYDLSGGTVSTLGTAIGGGDGPEFGNGGLYISGTGSYTDGVGMNVYDGTLELDSGTLTSVSIQVNTGGAFIWTGGTLDFDGIAGVTLNSSGLFGTNLSVTGTKAFGVLKSLFTIPSGSSFLNGTQTTLENVTNSGSFISTGTLSVTGTFTNSSSTILSGTQTWGSGSTFTNAAGTATFQSDAGSAPSSTMAMNITGGKVALSADQHWAGLTVSNGVLDLENTKLFVSYGSTDPRSTLFGYLQTGFNNGGWNGTAGIVSSNAATNSTNYGIGFADGADGVATGLSSGQIEIAYALLGDIKLNGVVNGLDFTILAQHFGTFVTGGWEQGDLNYDGVVNGADFSDLARNFGQTESGVAVALPASDWAALDSFAAANGLLADVPEPASMGLMLVAGITLLARRRRGV